MFNPVAIVTVLAPELLLAFAALAGLVAGAIIKARFNALAFRLGTFVLLAAALLASGGWHGGQAFDGLVQTNAFITVAKTISFIAAAIALSMTEGFLKRHTTLRHEYALLVIFASLGMGIMLSAADMMIFYLGMEMLALSSYVLAAFHRDNPRSAEAGLKYFVLGALASGILVYGMSLVYGFSGTTSYAAIAASTPGSGLLFGMVLIMIGLAFKVSAAPLHAWTPDVYEGAPSPVVAFFATAPKMAAMAAFAIIMFTVFSQEKAFANWQVIIAIIAATSMLTGTFGALQQTNLKRLLGYSAIANTGYALVALSAGPQHGAGALMVFMMVYVITTLGLFGGVLSMRREGGMVENIHELAGLVRIRPGLALALTCLLISVSGFPLAFGFFGKLAVIEAAWKAGLTTLIIILVASSVIAMYYYLRLIKIMWIDEPGDVFEPVESWISVIVYLTALISIGLLIFIDPVFRLVSTMGLPS